ncbi:manganese-dependent inorganic pyrophosphatase [Rubeoparvulum massiliense]|uniref:manganese-dependent inorganic pyrophosphatase n=1 Tax=Rubeoparvulum massiliense TaxID=1631346 RepID=UPI00065E54AB|nr:manganese-dependent inorganic pyrophosphatase [Rubeoparvulum massiliense]
MSNKVLVLGHKNPDTDSICSTIAYAALKQKLGMDAEPVRLGEISNETQFILDYFKVPLPRLVETVSNEVKQVILVDHNERQQSVDDLEQVQILEVVDHHRIANFATAEPLYYRAEPVGCSSTIVNKLYKEKQVQIDPAVAGLMLSAIISDTLLFKSPTCTPEDEAAARELAAIAGVDLESYGLAMLKAGANVSNKTIEELISLDSKEFPMGNAKVVIAQVNTVDPEELFARQGEFEAAIQQVIADRQLDLFVYVVTDILNNDSVVLVLGAAAQKVEVAFGVQLDNHKAVLKGVVSRKKQIVPNLTHAFTDK